MPYVIEYTQQDSSKRVYVKRLADSIPGYDKECGYPYGTVCSSTSEIAKASRWTREEAEARIARAVNWRGVKVIKVAK